MNFAEKVKEKKWLFYHLTLSLSLGFSSLRAERSFSPLTMLVGIAIIFFIYNVVKVSH
jgi:hypothetical protein